MKSYNWQEFLSRWNDLLISRSSIYSFSSEELIASDLNQKSFHSRWLGYDGATDDQIHELEIKSGIILPASYREFLKVSDGFRQPTNIVPRLFSTSDVQWYSANHQKTIDIWTDEVEDILVDEPDYFAQYLPYTLQVSAEEWGGNAVYLLNPKNINKDGEWEAFYFASWLPGANRYASFWELMQDEYHQLFTDSENP